MSHSYSAYSFLVQKISSILNPLSDNAKCSSLIGHPVYTYPLYYEVLTAPAINYMLHLNVRIHMENREWRNENYKYERISTTPTKKWMRDYAA